MSVESDIPRSNGGTRREIACCSFVVVLAGVNADVHLRVSPSRSRRPHDIGMTLASRSVKKCQNVTLPFRTFEGGLRRDGLVAASPWCSHRARMPRRQRRRQQRRPGGCEIGSWLYGLDSCGGGRFEAADGSLHGGEHVGRQAVVVRPRARGRRTTCGATTAATQRVWSRSQRAVAAARGAPQRDPGRAVQHDERRVGDREGGQQRGADAGRQRTMERMVEREGRRVDHVVLRGQRIDRVTPGARDRRSRHRRRSGSRSRPRRPAAPVCTTPPRSSARPTPSASWRSAKLRACLPAPANRSATAARFASFSSSTGTPRRSPSDAATPCRGQPGMSSMKVRESLAWSTAACEADADGDDRVLVDPGCAAGTGDRGAEHLVGRRQQLAVRQSRASRPGTGGPADIDGDRARGAALDVDRDGAEPVGHQLVEDGVGAAVAGALPASGSAPAASRRRSISAGGRLAEPGLAGELVARQRPVLEQQRDGGLVVEDPEEARRAAVRGARHPPRSRTSQPSFR